MTPRTRGHLALLLSPVTLFLSVFFLGPLIIIAVYSVLTPGLYGGVEWSFYHWNFGRIFGWADGLVEVFEPVYLQILLRSLGLAFLTVIICLILCYPVAFWIARLPQRARIVFLFLITLPFFASLIVRLYAWLLILKPSGLLGTVFNAVGLEAPEILYTQTAVILGMVYIFIPFMFLPLFSSVDTLDRSLIEASADLGAKPWQTFVKVIVPQTLPGIAGGSVIVFIPAVGNFIVPDVLGGAQGLMIGNMVEQQFLSSRNWPFGSALAMVIMAVVLAALMLFTARACKAGAAR
ncbi:MAG: ABC transporter permease [Tabrizicola sp.]|jgi:spermidine/putrescine transport system permease protein|nr:ABC transporter permease [Tabrizicola sp.]